MPFLVIVALSFGKPGARVFAAGRIHLSTASGKPGAGIR